MELGIDEWTIKDKAVMQVRRWMIRSAGSLGWSGLGLAVRVGHV